MTPQCGRIVVERPEPGWRDRLRSYVIEVDGQRRGRVKLGRVLVMDVSPGRHRIRARIDWTGSESIHIDVAAGVDVHLVVETTGTPIEFWQAFTRSGYLCLRQV